MQKQFLTLSISLLLLFILMGCDFVEESDAPRDTETDTLLDTGVSSDSTTDDTASETDTAEGTDNDSDTVIAQGEIEFRIVNNTDAVRFIQMEDYDDTPELRMKHIRLEHWVDGAWVRVNTYYNNICSEIAIGEQCTYVGDSWLVASPIEPGASYAMIWKGVEYQLQTTYCFDESSAMEGCYDKVSPAAGQYRLNVTVGDGCSPMQDDGVCYPSDGDMSFVSGGQTYTQEFSLPLDEPTVTLFIEQ